MAKIKWIGIDEIITWLKNPHNIPDLLNRPLRSALELAGIDPDTDFFSFGGIVDSFTHTITSSTSNATLGNLSGAALAVESGGKYHFRIIVAFDTAATTTGIRLGLTTPAGAILAQVRIPIAADGVDAFFEGQITSSGDSVVSSGIDTINTPRVAVIEGTCFPTADGDIQLQIATEVGGSQIRILNGTSGCLWRLS